MAFANGYSYRRTVTVDRSKIPTVASLTDFAALVTGTYAYLATVANGGKVQHASGYDIRFELADGTKLDHEVESWSSTTGAVNLWVRVPTVNGAGSGSDTQVYLYYGKSGLSATEANPTGVWGSQFKLVAHLKESPSDSAPEFKDSTSNANHGTESGTMASVAGQVGNGLTVTSGTSAHGSASSLQISNAFTVSLWIRLLGTQGDRYVCQRNSNNWAILYGYVSNNFEFFGAGYTGDNPRTGSQITLIAPSAWSHLAYTYDGATLRGYLNGAEVISVPKSFTLATGGATELSPNTVRPNASVDEWRIEDAAVSGSEIAARYNNQSSPSTFYAVGSEETPSTVVVSIAPTTSTLGVSQQQQFIPTVIDAVDPSVSWSVDPNEGMVNEAGLYTAPASIPDTHVVTVRATSVEDPTKYADAVVTLLVGSHRRRRRRSMIVSGGVQTPGETKSGAQTSTNSYAAHAQTVLDCTHARNLAITITVATNDIDWIVYGANVSNFSDKVEVQAESTVSAAGVGHFAGVAVYRYYRAEIKSSASGQHGVVTANSIARGILAEIIPVREEFAPLDDSGVITLAQDRDPSYPVLLSLNGVNQSLSTDFSVAGNVITLANPAEAEGATAVVLYWPVS